MEGGRVLVVISLLALAFSFATASDPNPIQDFCVDIKDAKNGGMFSLLFLFACIQIFAIRFKSLSLSLFCMQYL